MTLLSFLIGVHVFQHMIRLDSWIAVSEILYV